MEPSRSDDALVDVLDVLLRDGVVLRADVVVSVAEIPLVGIKLTAVVAGMETMTEYGLFEEWDTNRRAAAVARRQYGNRRRDREIDGERGRRTEEETGSRRTR
ncbi:gas vesicle protein GvpM [Natribaculum luteum]|uniref:Gas vesicle protein GvpM n=1 Tax=Natribaculum luteum TaxID=1586232 RepID=A0ABD5NU73_9EURY|nr:gas vesicle protein [Natribaculum luteum]